MKKALRSPLASSLITAVLLGAFAAAPVMTAATPAMANEATLFVVGPGYVQHVYRDGFFDRYGVWHLWRDAYQARDFQYRFRDRFIDEDHDVIPNRFDALPAHSYRN